MARREKENGVWYSGDEMNLQAVSLLVFLQNALIGCMVWRGRDKLMRRVAQLEEEGRLLPAQLRIKDLGHNDNRETTTKKHHGEWAPLPTQ